jgi:hypothetical protein
MLPRVRSECRECPLDEHIHDSEIENSTAEAVSGTKPRICVFALYCYHSSLQRLRERGDCTHQYGYTNQSMIS